MKPAQPIRHGVLVLLGGEGLRPTSLQLWERLRALAPQGMHRTVILPTALAVHEEGAAQRRITIATAALKQMGVEVSVLPIFSREQAADPAQAAALAAADGIYLSGGRPQVLYQVLAGTPVWEALLSAHAAGALLVASGGAAVALGSVAFSPPQLAPQALDALHFERLDGLGLLKRSAILPYYNWLPPQVIGQIVALFPPDTLLVGIDDQAALIGTADGWRVEGLGSVTIRKHSLRPLMVDAGQPIALDVLPPYPER